MLCDYEDEDHDSAFCVKCAYSNGYDDGFDNEPYNNDYKNWDGMM